MLCSHVKASHTGETSSSLRHRAFPPKSKSLRWFHDSDLTQLTVPRVKRTRPSYSTFSQTSTAPPEYWIFRRSSRSTSSVHTTNLHLLGSSKIGILFPRSIKFGPYSTYEPPLSLRTSPPAASQNAIASVNGPHFTSPAFDQHHNPAKRLSHQ